MKERVLYDGELEKQLKEKADQFKMYPSDQVWNEVYSSLHTRRRRFVAGMSVLIGSILILAGSQLIFPSRPVQGKITTAGVNTSKPAVATVLPSFATGDLVNTPSSNPTDTKTSAANRVVNSPYILSAAPAANLSNPGDFAENLPEKNITTTHVKSSQPDNLNIPVPLGASPVDAAEVHETPGSIQNIAEVNSVSAELVPEKSATQLTHLRNDRFSWEIYFTPTLNTHYLTGLDYQTMAQSIQSSPIMLVNVSNVNGFVDNTPILGYNVGGNVLYKLSKNFSLKAGVEFSFNRYYIKAYNSGSSQTSVALNSYFGYVTNPINSIPGSGTDKNPQQYQNRYYQLSLPVGAEMKVAGNGRVQLHLGASLQPSYLLNTDAYVLSNDYKGYTKDAQAFRRWNLNAGAEAYISYGVGNIRWELGPQVRYQIFSTYKNSYPLKENMLNYGIRIGISKTIR
jgi:Outer membrane protein beta-barrel domain